MNYEIEFSIQAEVDLRGIYEGRNMDSELLEHTKL